MIPEAEQAQLQYRFAQVYLPVGTAEASRREMPAAQKVGGRLAREGMKQ